MLLGHLQSLTCFGPVNVRVRVHYVWNSCGFVRNKLQKPNSASSPNLAVNSYE